MRSKVCRCKCGQTVLEQWSTVTVSNCKCGQSVFLYGSHPGIDQVKVRSYGQMLLVGTAKARIQGRCANGRSPMADSAAEDHRVMMIRWHGNRHVVTRDADSTRRAEPRSLGAIGCGARSACIGCATRSAVVMMIRWHGNRHVVTRDADSTRRAEPRSLGSIGCGARSACIGCATRSAVVGSESAAARQAIWLVCWREPKWAGYL
jgi:hypothetical protein